MCCFIIGFYTLFLDRRSLAQDNFFGGEEGKVKICVNVVDNLGKFMIGLFYVGYIST